MTLCIRSYKSDDEDTVVELWNQCDLTRPWNDPRQDIACKMKLQPELFLVAEKDDMIVGSVMAGFDGHRGWINYLAVDPTHRRRGFGRQLIDAAEMRLRSLGCPKINLQIRDDNRDAIAFYQRIGFAPDPVISMGKRLPAGE
ncbi:MAG: GNAT family acetyltransferase [Rubripirellula sp.]